MQHADRPQEPADERTPARRRASIAKISGDISSVSERAAEGVLVEVKERQRRDGGLRGERDVRTVCGSACR